MKVAFVTQPFDTIVPNIGGSTSIPILTYQFAQRFADAGHNIRIYGKQDHNHPDAEEDQYGIGYRRIDTRWDDLAAKPFKLLDRLTPRQQTTRPIFARGLYYSRYIQQIAKDLRAYQPDIVHIHNFSQFARPIRQHNPQTKIVLHMHCEWLTQLDADLIAARLKHVDLVIGVSNHITNKIRERFPQHAAKCHTVFNGVDVDYFTPPANKQPPDNAAPGLLFSGRVSPEKGIHVLIEAFLEVLGDYPTAELKIAGLIAASPVKFIVALSDDLHVKNLATFYQGDDYYTQLTNKITPDAARQIHFLGHMPQPELLQHYHQADLLINPSLSEAFGMSLAEAMSTETAVIGTRVGGMQDVVADGETGLLVDPADPSALANAIKTLLANPAQRQAMGRAGRQRAATLFSWDSVSQRLLTLYQPLVLPRGNRIRNCQEKPA